MFFIKGPVLENWAFFSSDFRGPKVAQTRLSFYNVQRNLSLKVARNKRR
jgi:hypothetical protein